MSSHFLVDGGGGDLSSLQNGTFAASLASLSVTSLAPSLPVKTTPSRALTTGQIGLSDCSFTPLTGLTSAGGSGTVSLLGPTAGSLKALTATGGVALTSSSATINLGVPALDASANALAGPGMRDSWVQSTDPVSGQITNSIIVLPSGRLLASAVGLPFYSDDGGVTFTAATGSFGAVAAVLAYSQDLNTVLLRSVNNTWLSTDSGVSYAAAAPTTGFATPLALIWSRVAQLFIMSQNGTPGATIATSPTGVVWTSRSSSQTCRSIFDAGSYVVVVGDTGASRSVDGLTWGVTSAIGMFSGAYDTARDCIVAAPIGSISAMYESFDRGLTWATYASAKPATLNARALIYVPELQICFTVQRTSGEGFASWWDPTTATLRVTSIYGTVATAANEVSRLVYAPTVRRFCCSSNIVATCQWTGNNGAVVAMGGGALSGSQLDIRALAAPDAVRSDKFGKVYLDSATSDVRLLYGSVTYPLGGFSSSWNKRIDGTLTQSLWTDGVISFSWENSTRQLKFSLPSSTWYSVSAVGCNTSLALTNTIAINAYSITYTAGASYYAATGGTTSNASWGINQVANPMVASFNILPVAGALAASIPVYVIQITGIFDRYNVSIRKQYQA